MNAKGASGELSDRNEECVLGHWPKGHPCHQVARNLAKLCSSVLWKVQLVKVNLEISKQSVEDFSLLLTITWEGRQTR